MAVIQEKLNNPSPDDPFEPDIAAVRCVWNLYTLLPITKVMHLTQLMKTDNSKFLATAKEWTKK